MRRVGFWAALAAAAGLLACASVSAALGASFTPKPSTCKDASLRPTSKDIARVIAATLCLIERERSAYELGPLRANSSLQRIATSQAKAMVVGDYFGDDSPSGSTPWQRITASAYAAGAHSIAAAQNIGWGTSRMATPAGMVSIWMHSPPHRQIVLTSGYRDIGIGVAPAAPTKLTKGAPGATYTVEFAARG